MLVVKFTCLMTDTDTYKLHTTDSQTNGQHYHGIHNASSNKKNNIETIN